MLANGDDYDRDRLSAGRYAAVVSRKSHPMPGCNDQIRLRDADHHRRFRTVPPLKLERGTLQRAIAGSELIIIEDSGHMTVAVF